MNQRTFKTKEGETILAVVVAKDSFNFQLHEQAISYFISDGEYWKRIREMIDMNLIDMNLIDDHSYLEDVGTIIGLLSSLTEDQAKELVKEPLTAMVLSIKHLLGYWNYSNKRVWDKRIGDFGSFPFRTAKESLQSLIESLELILTQDVLLIKVN